MPPSGGSKISFGGGRGVSGMECFFHFEHGFCKWGDHCRYSHAPTGFRAEAPHQDEFGATAGSNARRNIRVYTRWQGQPQPVVYHSRNRAKDPAQEDDLIEVQTQAQAQAFPGEDEDREQKREPKPYEQQFTDMARAVHDNMGYDDNRGFPIKGRDEAQRRVRYDLDDTYRSRSRSPYKPSAGEARLPAHNFGEQGHPRTAGSRSPYANEPYERTRLQMSSGNLPALRSPDRLQRRRADENLRHHARQLQPLAEEEEEEGEIVTKHDSHMTGDKYDFAFKLGYSSRVANESRTTAFDAKSASKSPGSYHTTAAHARDESKSRIEIDIKAAQAILIELDHAVRWLSGASQVAANVPYLLSRVRRIVGSASAVTILDNFDDKANTASTIMQPLADHMATWKDEVNRCVATELRNREERSSNIEPDHDSKTQQNEHVDKSSRKESDKAFI